MKLAGPWLDTAQPVLCALTRAGHKAWPVGGCVRNAVLGLPVTDTDIATDALPAAVIAAAKDAGLRAVPTGLDHGTVTLVHDGRGYEVTTLRRDVETDGRHARVAFDADLAQDAARRDFTMNALYVMPDGALVDPLGGLPDLLSRHVRFVGDPAARIAEDALRILRFFRFTAQYGDPDLGIDPDGLAACATGQAGLDGLSAERITAELRKLLGAPFPARAVAAMAQAGILARLLPGADARALAPLVHHEGVLPPFWLRRLATLGGDDARLRLTRVEARDLPRLRDAAGNMAPPAELGHHLGESLARDAMLVRAALLEIPLPADWAEQVTRGAQARFPVLAQDLAPLAGAELGARLRDLKARWIASDFRLSRDDLLN
jgi:poly(A) polymerase